MVNGQVVNIPSYQLRPGDIVSIRPRSRLNRTFVENVKNHRQAFSWLEADRRTLSGKFLDFPERSDIPENIREQLIVELYSK